MFVTHLLFCKHIILYILYILLYTFVMHCDKIFMLLVSESSPDYSCENLGG